MKRNIYQKKGNTNNSTLKKIYLTYNNNIINSKSKSIKYIQEREMSQTQHTFCKKCNCRISCRYPIKLEYIHKSLNKQNNKNKYSELNKNIKDGIELNSWCN